jgi:hypothetical protein
MRTIFSRMPVLVGLGALRRSARPQQMTGTITDQSGAFAPYTLVTVTNINTGVARSSITDSSGNCLVTALLPSTCRVITQSPGFKQMSREPIILEVDQIARGQRRGEKSTPGPAGCEATILN